MPITITAACGFCTPDPPTDWVKGICVFCWSWKHRPKFRADLERAGTVVAQPKKSLPCVHVGEPLTVKEKEANGLDRSKYWHWCKIGETANKKGVPGAACSCEGCGPKCKGYVST